LEGVSSLMGRKLICCPFPLANMGGRPCRGVTYYGLSNKRELEKEKKTRSLGKEKGFLGV